MTSKPYWELLSYDDPQQRLKWQTLCNSFDDIDVYFYPEYSRLFELHGDGKPYLFVYYESSEKLLIYPFLKRPIKALPIFHKISENLFDTTSPYGYGGYLRNNNNINMENFYLIFHQFCNENNIVSEFIRFNPLLNNVLYAPKNVIIKKSNDTVVIDLTNESDKIWMDMASRCRNSIRKALKNNITVINDTKFEELNIFYKLYIDTMLQLKAHSYYFFSINWFYEVVNLLKGRVALFHAYYQDKIITSAIFVYNKDYINYFLTGSVYDMRNLAANNLLLYEVALWAKNRGLKYFQLGGGYQTNDTLSRFKASFSPHQAQFYIGGVIHQPEKYEYLCNMRLQSDAVQSNLNYFPVYRLPKEL